MIMMMLLRSNHLRRMHTIDLITENTEKIGRGKRKKVDIGAGLRLQNILIVKLRGGSLVCV